MADGRTAADLEACVGRRAVGLRHLVASPTLVLERGGHAALWEDPVAGAAALLAFLAG